MLTKNDFFYEIPKELVAQEPAQQRDGSRLLVCDGATQKIEDKLFCDLPKLVGEFFSQPKTLFIVNDSRVYPARVRVARKTGARGEVFLLETGEKSSYHCLLRPLSKLKLNEVLYSDSTGEPLFFVDSLDPPKVRLFEEMPLQKFLDKHGEMPLPPYIDRDPKRVAVNVQKDKERYQTVYSDVNKLGSAAAPTAGLHFTPEIMSQCVQEGCEFVSVTLHVGLGTFAPVQSENLKEHPMHEEYFFVSEKTLCKIKEYESNGWPIVYVGTTSLRAVESFFRRAENEQLTETWHRTNLFLYPENKETKILPKVGSAILTNFHQPESTLVMLVAALMGYDFWKMFYNHAMEKKYRFYSYGDSSLLIFNRESR